MRVRAHYRRNGSNNKRIKVRSHSRHMRRNYSYLIPRWGKGMERRFEETELVKVGKKPLAIATKYPRSQKRSEEKKFKRFVKKEGLKYKTTKKPLGGPYKTILVYKDPKKVKPFLEAKSHKEMGESLGYPKKAAKKHSERIKGPERALSKEEYILGYTTEGMSDKEIEAAIKRKEKALKVTYLR